MRMHTALHLLSVVIPLPVTGGQITSEKGRLDFDMPDAPEDKQVIEDQLNNLIARDYSITTSWISDDELLKNPSLVKTMSVQPPMGTGKVRLVRIGNESEVIDLQPCGGTHVKITSEIGPIVMGKVVAVTVIPVGVAKGEVVGPGIQVELDILNPPPPPPAPPPPAITR